jgi:flagellar hook assembly protein FlgD
MNARLDIYNVRGQRVKTMLNAALGKGKHTLEWSGRDEHGRPVSSGIYFSRLTTPEGSFVQKMMLMK